MSQEKQILIQGARSNNLKNITVGIPRNQFVVVTGVSGSGKSSLTIDTLYAEGQRRYVESLSSYARQFLGRMKKPDVDFIKGICPAIAIEQRVSSSSSSRSTVGSMTEIYDYLRLLYARVGRTVSPVSGREVRKHEVNDAVLFIMALPETTPVQVLVPFHIPEGRTLTAELNLLLQKGFTRLLPKDATALTRIEDLLPEIEAGNEVAIVTAQSAYILIDRFVVKYETDPAAEIQEELRKRAADSVQTALVESGGDCHLLYTLPNGVPTTEVFNSRFELDGMAFPEVTPYLFNYNNPYGACPVCEGFGKTIGLDERKIIPDRSKSIYEGAIAPWTGEIMSEYKQAFLRAAYHIDFPVHRAWRDLTDAERDLVWRGNERFMGINGFFEFLDEQKFKIQYRIMAARYRGKTTCPTCGGARLRKEAQYVLLGGTPITALMKMPLVDLKAHFETLELRPIDVELAKRLLFEIETRLAFLVKIGLGYLHLDRAANTLSGGETQRIHLTRTLGSNLTSSMYILDEPSIGLHPRDTGKLVEVLKNLRDLGNTVVVVEHEEEMIKNADYLIDIGPAAGVHGGNVVFAGPYSRIETDAADSLTARYMNGTLTIPVPATRRTATRFITITDVWENNLKGVTATIPLGVLTVVTGVSGSGKTTLIKQVVVPALQQQLGETTTERTTDYGELTGDVTTVTQIELINQSPIGRSSRSNPVTYVKAYDEIRELFADQHLSQVRGFKPKHFSFNVEGGRCETCKGEGEQIVEMQFLADVRLECDDCRGQRFQKEVLDVTYNGKNIFEVLQLTIEEALTFFADKPALITKLRPLSDVGLGYVQLGQSSSTLSGGEAQRVKLASFLGKERGGEHIIFVFDEPTTGLHFHDISKLLAALNALVEKGHTVVVIEHNMEVIKCADYILDLGPEGGNAGGHLVFAGTPEAMLTIADGSGTHRSYTAEFLREKM